MKIEVTQEDIDRASKHKDNPIEYAVLRQYAMDCSVDKKFIVFEGNRFPFRLPLGAEVWVSSWFRGVEVKPFSFDVAG
jgi:hypothetical protein